MSPNIDVTEDVKDLVTDIINTHNLDPDSEVIYSVGSEVGDGYLSKTVSVDITDNEQTLHVFIKYPLNFRSEEIPMDNAYANEIYFYDVILPTFLKFGEERGVKKAFRNVPECLGTWAKEILALENLKKRNFELFDRKKIMNENHIASVLKSFAQYHAISFAFRDQDEDGYKELAGRVSDVFTGNLFKNMLCMMENVMKDFQNQLDPIRDKRINDSCNEATAQILDYFNKFVNAITKHSVIGKGDCWNNNIMFRYKGDDRTNPAEVMLVDWQMLCNSSLVVDISYFFYTVAAEEHLGHLNHYMKLYHDELSRSILRLGSDPEILYPYSAFEKEWKDHAIFGYGMSLITFVAMFVSQEEVPDFEDMNKQNKSMPDLFKDISRTPEHYKRIKSLTEHFIDNNLI